MSFKCEMQMRFPNPPQKELSTRYARVATKDLYAYKYKCMSLERPAIPDSAFKAEQFINPHNGGQYLEGYLLDWAQVPAGIQGLSGRFIVLDRRGTGWTTKLQFVDRPDGY